MNLKTIDITSAKWKLLTVRANPNEKFRTSSQDGNSTLEINNEGKFSGYSGCNGFGGDVIIEKYSVEFRRKGLSMSRGCPGGIESVLLEALANVNNYSIKDGELFLKKGTHVLMTYSVYH